MFEARPGESVYIVDDDAAICEGLQNLLDSVGIPSVCFSSAESFAAGWTAEHAGCLLLDARLPGMSGVEFQEKLRKAGAMIPIIFMTAHGDIPMVRRVMKSGAIEFLTKPFQKEELLQVIEQAFLLDRGRRAEERAVGAIRARMASLTEREVEVMGMVTTGMLNKQIAAELKLSEITIKLHRRHVMEKMEADSLAELVKMCERAKNANRISRNGRLPV